jgi:hypothetical protein
MQDLKILVTQKTADKWNTTVNHGVERAMLGSPGGLVLSDHPKLLA